MSDVIHAHIWAPANSAWSDIITGLLGAASAHHEFTAGGETLSAARWTCPNDQALAKERIRRLFTTEHAPTEFGELTDEQGRFWPRASFSLTEDPGFPDELVAPDAFDVVGGSPDMWIHFVDAGAAAPSTFTYEDAVAADVWGIEESLLDAEGASGGWWITTEPEPGPTPQRLHSVY